MTIMITKREKHLLRRLVEEAWEAELNAELEQLFEHFCQWAERGMSAFELSDEIHAFHNGVSRELFSRYTRVDPVMAVSRAVAAGVLSEDGIDDELFGKLVPLVDTFRNIENK